jgi:hypothetical protein
LPFKDVSVISLEAAEIEERQPALESFRRNFGLKRGDAAFVPAQHRFDSTQLAVVSFDPEVAAPDHGELHFQKFSERLLIVQHSLDHSLQQFQIGFGHCSACWKMRLARI